MQDGFIDWSEDDIIREIMSYAEEPELESIEIYTEDYDG